MTEYLNYCKVCIHRKKDTQFGFICKIGDKKPTFTKTCNNYKFENGVIEQLIENQKDFYESILGREMIFEKDKLTIRLSKKQSEYEIQTISQLPDRVEVYSSKLLNGIFGLLGIGAAIFNDFDEKISLTNWASILFSSLMFFGGCFFLYQGFIKKNPILVLNENGIIYKKKIIKWSTIVLTSFQKEWKEGENRTTITNLVIDTLSGKEKIEVGLWNMNEPELGHYLELFKEKYKRQK